MIVKLFKPEFAPLVKSGAKKTTIRPIPKRVPKIGEEIQFRQWTGLPYRSRQKHLGKSVITKVKPIIVGDGFVAIGHVENGKLVYPMFVGGSYLIKDLKAFAEKDGFSSVADFFGFFRANYELPFCGILIRWD